MKFNAKDEKAVLGLGRCGHFTESHFRSSGYSLSRIKNRSCGEKKLYEKIGRDVKTGENVYKLTELGKEKCAELGLARDLQYRCQGLEKSMNFEHDRKLADIYCSLDQECQDRWKTEEMYKIELEEVREHIREHEPDRWEEIKDEPYSAFDGGYIDHQGQEQYVEVATSSYKKEDYESKANSVAMCSGNYNLYKA